MSESGKPKDEIPDSLDLKVREEDLVVRSRTQSLLDFLGGFGFGMLGFLPLSVGTGFFDWSFLHIGVYFLMVWASVGYLTGMLTFYFRPKIVRHFFVGREFAVGYGKYRSFLIRSFILAGIIAIPGLLFTYLPRAWQTANAGLILSGIAYFALIPSLTAAQALKSNNQASLSILQFLKAGTPDNKAKSWLKRGLRRVEDRVSEDGICSVERDSLFLGCLYHLFNGANVTTDLISLSHSLVNPSLKRSPSIGSLLASAGEARTLGLSSVPIMVERIIRMPGWVISIITGLAIYLLILTLSYFGIPSPIIEGLKEIFSH